MAHEQGDELPPEKQDAKPEAGKKPQDGPLSESEFQGLMHGIIHDCGHFVDTELSPERAKATQYYKGEPFGNEEPGRSQYVSTDVRDAVRGTIPQLGRVFFGPQRIAEFIPRNAATVEQAVQQTELVHHVFMVENCGFLTSRNVWKDGLLKQLGIFKWWWDDSKSELAYEQKGLTTEQVVTIITEEGVKLTRVVKQDDDMLDIEYTRVESEGCARVEAVPPEEFIFSREARSRDHALCVAHRTELTRGQLIALGIDAEVVDTWGHKSSELDNNEEEIARASASTVQNDPEAGEANDKILYVEAYPYIDFDGDGIAELRKVCTIGPSYHVVKNKPCDERPFALFCPDPEPHSMLGLSYYNLLGDTQRMKSSLVRGAADSLSASIFPRTGYVEGQVSVQDILNTAIGAPIRMKQAGMIQPITHPFVGKEAFPFIQMMDDVIERRTGQNKGAMGLDADALQSSTKSAVGAAVTASQAQTEDLARIFAETLKGVLCGIRNLLIKYQPRAKAVRMRGQWVDVDPRVWDSNLDVEVNVALGTGFKEEKIAVLEGVAAKQEQILSTLGPQNPIVSLAQYRNTLATAVELAGWKNPERFFNEVDPNWQPPQQPPQPSPEMALVEVEKQKAEVAAQAKAVELQQKQQLQDAELEFEREKLRMQFTEAQMKADMERQKLEAEMEIKLRELELKYNVELEIAKIKAAVDAERESHKQEAETNRDATREAAETHREHIRADREDQRAAREGTE